MKKSIFLCIAVLVLAGCAKVEPAEIFTPEEKAVTTVSEQEFALFAPTSATKTTNDGLNTSWNALDSITVFHAVTGTATYGSNDKFIITEDNLSSGKFTGTLSDGELASDQKYDWYAIYPHESHIETPANTSKGYHAIGGKNKSTAQVQAGNDSKAHLAGKFFPLYGKATEGAAGTAPSITMKQALSVIKVHVTNSTDDNLTVASVVFTATESIAGTFYINFAGDTPVFTGSGDDYVSDMASLNVTGGSALEKNGSADFYIAIKPFTAAGGQSLKLSVNGYEKTIVLTKDVTFSAGKIKTLNFDYDKPAPSQPTGDGYYRVMSANWLEPGDTVMIVSIDNTGTVRAMGKYDDGDNFPSVSTAWNSDGNFEWLKDISAIQKFVLESNGTNNYSFKSCGKTDRYIYASSSNKNQLKERTENPRNEDNNSNFNVSIPEGVASIVATGDNTRNTVRYNSSSKLFSCYASSGSQNDVAIYKLYGKETCYEPVIEFASNTVTITCGTEGATIHYTMDGTDPTSGSTEYTAGFQLTETGTVKAIAVKSGCLDSPIASKLCEIATKCATPVISYNNPTVTITCATEAATIYYTTDGSVPSSTSGTAMNSGESFDLTATSTVKAIAIKSGLTDSDIAEQTCTYVSQGTTKLTNADIVAAGDAASGYASYTLTDSNKYSYSAYSIKNYQSKATINYHYLQIKKYAPSTAYYIQIPTMPGNVQSITMTVSGSNKAMDGGGNTATLYFSSSNSTSAAGTGIASGTGASSITIDASGLGLKSGYITANGAIRIWDIEIKYAK